MLQNSSNYNAVSNSIVITSSSVGLGFKTLSSNAGSNNLAIGTESLSSNISGSTNIAVGVSSLSANTANANGGVGFQALFSNTTGVQNFALGLRSLHSNTTGLNNTAIGAQSLFSGIGTFSNVGIGASALFSNTGGNGITAIGYQALVGNTTGLLHVAVGSQALASNTTGSRHTAIGTLALSSILGGQYTLALGYQAGSAYSAGETSDIVIHSSGTAGENNILRIGQGTGTGDQQLNKTYISGIYNITTDSATTATLLCSNGNQLGTLSSSIRNKEMVEDMGDKSSPLLSLRPVTFSYKNQKEKRVQFGFIAEEVIDILPEVVTCDKEGRPDSVQYHLMPAMLLNEIQKLNVEIERQQLLIDEMVRKGLIEKNLFDTNTEPIIDF